ncbi:DMT family transporter [Roseovarius spongiae]|uniref:DMT family transporter n=1 Tax=Roseovarius spongiae TaxID=2320272 RepID=A0A3A8AYV4_9RHOB|nr:DMT family transporter [Roseovarius spongiae]RKF16050.1 DMT family transporter [Roseovarius spongiae]
MTTIRPINWLKIATLGMIWGGSFMAVSVALTGVGPLILVAARLSLGAAFLLLLAHLRGVGLPRRRGPNAATIWFCAVLMGLFSNALPFFLLSWGQQYVASGFAGVCMAVVPLFVLPLAHVFVPGDRLTLRRGIGFLIGTVGVMVLIGPAAFAATGENLENIARIACISASGCYAVGTIVTRLCPKVEMLSLSAAALTIAALTFTPYALWAEGWPSDVPWLALAALLYLGVLPTGVAQMLLVQVIRDAGPVFMSLVNYQVPIWSVIFGVMLLGEELPPGLIWALLLILSGLALSQAGALARLFGRGKAGKRPPHVPRQPLG